MNKDKCIVKLYNIFITLVGIFAILILTYDVNNFTDFQAFILKFWEDWQFGLAFIIALLGYFNGSTVAQDVLGVINNVKTRNTKDTSETKQPTVINVINTHEHMRKDDVADFINNEHMYKEEGEDV